MPEEQTANKASEQIDASDDKQTHAISTLILIACGSVFVIGLLVLSFVAYYYVNEHSVKTKFLADSSLNLLILVAILFQAYVYVRQWNAMERSLERTDRVIENMDEQVVHMKLQHVSNQGQLLIAAAAAEAAREAAEMAKGQLVAMQHQEQTQFQSLEAIKGQAKTMDRSLVLGTRAYLGVHSISFDGGKKRIFLHIENIGKVPAKDIQVIVEIRVEVPDTKYQAQCRNRPQHDWAKIGDERHIQIPRMFRFGRTKLFPGSLKIPVMIRLDESAYFSEEQIGLITSGDAKLMVQGFILYSDGFHSGKKTEFAFRYFIKDNLWVPRPSEGFGQFQIDPEKPDSDYNPS